MRHIRKHYRAVRQPERRQSSIARLLMGKHMEAVLQTSAARFQPVRSTYLVWGPEERRERSGSGSNNSEREGGRAARRSAAMLIFLPGT